MPLLSIQTSKKVETTVRLEESTQNGLISMRISLRRLRMMW